MRLAILGSTGSIGRQMLEVVSEHLRRPAGTSDDLQIVALAAYRGLDELARQVERYRPLYVAAAGYDPGDRYDREELDRFRERLQTAAAGRGRSSPLPVPRVMGGAAALEELAALAEVDLVVVAVVGAGGLRPTLAAIGAGKRVALANKETLVIGGELVRAALARTGTAGRRANGSAPAGWREGLAGDRLRPIDSEHSAIWQCLGGARGLDAGGAALGELGLERLILTASGGPLRSWPVERLPEVSVEQVLAHPTWKMGPRITVDSATMMNKGFEVLEASFLFGVPEERIEVVIHPESVAHSLVEWADGSVLAQLGWPDMRLPIQYALFYPRRLPSGVRRLDLTQVRTLSFLPVESSRYPCLALARQAGRAGGTYPAVLNAADEEAVAGFLKGLIRFTDIAAIVEETLAKYQGDPAGELSLPAVEQADTWARRKARELIQAIQRG